MDVRAPAQDELRNNVLRTLPGSAFTLLQPRLEPVPLPARMKLAEAGRPTGWFYFPDAGIASVVSQTSRTWQEVGIIGRDGAGSYSGLLGTSIAPYTILMQIEGCGHRIRADALVAAMDTSAPLRGALLQAMYAFIVQVSQTAVANVQCNITERLARWILMVQDRLDHPTIGITHEFLAEGLGVGRTGVTLALHELEKSRLINTGRKRIDILDRARLELLAGASYGFAEQEYTRLVGPLARPAIVPPPAPASPPA